MTIEEAVKDLLQSEEFHQACQNTPYLRNQLSRFKRGELKAGSMVQLLTRFGYKIEAKKPRILKYKMMK